MWLRWTSLLLTANFVTRQFIFLLVHNRSQSKNHYRLFNYTFALLIYKTEIS